MTNKKGFYDIGTLQSDFNPKLTGAVFFRGAAVGHDGVEVQPRQDRHVRLPRRPQVVDQAQGKFELKSNVIKRFLALSLTVCQSKLECLSLESFFRLGWVRLG